MKQEDDFSYVFMQLSDAPEVGRLACRIWHAHYPSLIPVEQIDYMLARGYTTEALHAHLAAGQKILLLKQDGEIKGFLGIGALSQIDNSLVRGARAGEGCYFIHRLYLAPGLHGKGMGHALFNEILKRLPDVALIRLQVNRDNRQAQKFYERQGFKTAAEIDLDIGGGFFMRDYVMQWEKPQNRA